MKRKLRTSIVVAAVGIGWMLFGLQTAFAAGKTASSVFKDGTYTGKRVNTFYGYFRVQAVVSGGKLADVVVLEYPDNDRRSLDINTRVLPYLVREAVTEQSYALDSISGATLTCKAFTTSLQDALKAAGA